MPSRLSWFSQLGKQTECWALPDNLLWCLVSLSQLIISAPLKSVISALLYGLGHIWPVSPISLLTH